MAYNYYQQNPHYAPMPVMHPTSPAYFHDSTNQSGTLYGSYNGQPFTMLTPSPVDSSMSSGYGSDVSPYAYQQNVTPYSTVPQASNWYPTPQTQPYQTPQPLVSKKTKTTPETENIMRQIFGNTPDSSFQAPKVAPKTKKADQQQTAKSSKVTVAKQPAVPVLAQIQDDLDLGNLDEFDYDNFDLNDDEERDENDVSHPDKKRRVLSKPQRLAANVRERKRMNIMNEAFVNLKAALPQKTGRKRRKMSRLDIVIGALEYISYLDELLQTEGPIENNFEAYQRSLDFY